MYGSDGREQVEYDLITTNVFSAEATLGALRVRGDGRTLLTLAGDPLAAFTRKLFTDETTAAVASASSVFTQIDVVLPRSYGRPPPRRFTNRMTATIPDDVPSRGIIGSTSSSSAILRSDPRPPLVISPPLRGASWLNANGCCRDPTSPHRQTLLASDGDWVSPETFAVDWIKELDGRYYTGDGSQLSDWPGFGEPVHAVADGTVVVAVDGMPDIPPLTKNPDLRTPEDYAGNNVIVALGDGRYAVFDHLVLGSVHVRRGQRVRTGQVLGKLGNSGNTDGPHLHFGIQSRPDSLSPSLSFEIDRLVLEGHAGPPPAPGAIDVVGTPTRLRRAHPLITSVATFKPR